MEFFCNSDLDLLYAAETSTGPYTTRAPMDQILHILTIHDVWDRPKLISHFDIQKHEWCMTIRRLRSSDNSLVHPIQHT